MKRVSQSIPTPLRLTVLVVALVVASFALMLNVEATRWNVVTELWGVFGAGALFWFFTERQSEDLRRRTWLRTNRDEVARVLDAVATHAGGIASNTLGLAPDLYADLVGGQSRDARRRAAQRARLLVPTVTSGAAEEFARPLTAEEPLVQEQVGLETALAHSGEVFARLANLRAAMAICLDRCRTVTVLSPLLQGGAPIGGATAWLRHSIPAQAGQAAITLCEACADVLSEAEVLPAR